MKKLQKKSLQNFKKQALKAIAKKKVKGGIIIIEDQIL